MTASVAADLALLTALDERGDPVALGRFWATAPAVVAFVRHFG